MSSYCTDSTVTNAYRVLQLSIHNFRLLIFCRPWNKNATPSRDFCLISYTEFNWVLFTNFQRLCGVREEQFEQGTCGRKRLVHVETGFDAATGEIGKPDWNLPFSSLFFAFLFFSFYFCFVFINMYLLYCIPLIVLLPVGQDIAVGIATLYGMDGPGIESRWGRGFPQPIRPALWPTQPPVQWVPEHFRG